MENISVSRICVTLTCFKSKELAEHHVERLRGISSEVFYEEVPCSVCKGWHVVPVFLPKPKTEKPNIIECRKFLRMEDNIFTTETELIVTTDVTFRWFDSNDKVVDIVNLSNGEGLSIRHKPLIVQKSEDISRIQMD